MATVDAVAVGGKPLSGCTLVPSSHRLTKSICLSDKKLINFIGEICGELAINPELVKHG